MTFIPTVFGSPHLVAVHSPALAARGAVSGRRDRSTRSRCRWRRSSAGSTHWRTRSGSGWYARSRAAPHTTSELAFAWDLTTPEVSRHLAVLRRAGLLTTERRGRYVHYSVDLPALTALGADLLAAMLR